jgi:glycosyltransferase involved in cell wall biosynthesis
MALGKGVVVTKGPVTDGLVDQGQALVVPAADPDALREAIVAAWTNAELRASTARCGHEYAQSLGDEGRLHRDLLDVVLRCCGDASS